MDTQTQDVSGDSSPIAGAPVQDAAAPIGSDTGSADVDQTNRSGDVTAQSDLEASADAQEGTTPPPSEDDPLKDVPSIDELKAQAEQRVPYAKALLQIREAYEARKSELGELQARIEPLQPILNEDVETVQSKLEAYNSLFTPLVNPQTGQPELDERGFERLTTLPFIEKIDGENPGMAEDLLFDALNYEADNGTGHKQRLYQQPHIQEAMLRACGLDPTRADDYRNIDALHAQTNGEITPEQLNQIPEQFHEAFKSFNEEQRKDLLEASPLARDGYLQDRAEALAAKAERVTQAETQRQQAQQAEANLRQQVTTAQESFVSEQLQAGYTTFMDDLASKVTFSDDAKINEGMHGLVGSFLLALRYPDSRFAAEKTLGALGVKVEQGFYEALETADKHYRDGKAFEMFGQHGRKAQSLAQAKAAKDQVFAKLAPIGMKVASMLGGQAQARANGMNKLLGDATSARPVLDAGENGHDTGGILPPGMRADSPEADRYLMQKYSAGR